MSKDVLKAVETEEISEYQAGLEQEAVEPAACMLSFLSKVMLEGHSPQEQESIGLGHLLEHIKTRVQDIPASCRA